MFTFIISFILLNLSGTQKVLYCDSHYGLREAHGLVTAGAWVLPTTPKADSTGILQGIFYKQGWFSF